jgi:glycosyltransferase involved in cell wall biosynthesis
LYADRRPTIVHAWLDEANLVAALAVGRWPAAKLVISQRCARPAYRSVPYWPWALRALRSRVDHAIANSVDGLEYLRSLGYKPERTSLIRNGLPPEAGASEVPLEELRERARRRLGLQNDGPVVGFVGSANELKDLGTLFGAMARVLQEVPNARLLLVGPTGEDLRRLRLTPPDRTTALGWLPSPSYLMPAFDVLALSSRTEGHSNAVDEALLAGVPVATTDVGDHPEIVAETGGKVTPVRRPDALGAAILELLHRPPPREQIRTVAARRLAMAPVIDATHEIYMRLLNGTPRSTMVRR